MPDFASPFDLLIQGGTLIDGTRAPRRDADIGIVDGRIADIGDLAGRPARRTLDATGRIVAPGFIDSHTHDDQALLSDPAMPSIRVPPWISRSNGLAESGIATPRQGPKLSLPAWWTMPLQHVLASGLTRRG